MTAPNDATRKTQTRVMFDLIAPQYDQAGPGCVTHFGRRLVDVADVSAGQSVLDVATGRGAVLFPAAERAGATGTVVGIDLSDGMVNAVNAEAIRRGITARTQVMDAESLDFPDGSFDRVLCGLGLMFFPNQVSALIEMRRVLKPGGRLAASTWKVTHGEDLRAVLDTLGHGRPEPPGWISDPDVLAAKVNEAGFADSRVTFETETFVFADLDEYWETARGTTARRILDGLDGAATARVRAALTERLADRQRPDGLHIQATVLIATATR